jgi:trehalose/maltose hydrolase-like predicted phosphorylase
VRHSRFPAAAGPDRARELGVDLEESAGWRDAAKAMFIPYDEALGVHPQDEGFTGARTERLQHFLRGLAGKRLGRSRPERLAQPNPGCGRNHNNVRC